MGLRVESFSGRVAQDRRILAVALVVVLVLAISIMIMLIMILMQVRM